MTDNKKHLAIYRRDASWEISLSASQRLLAVPGNHTVGTHLAPTNSRSDVDTASNRPMGTVLYRRCHIGILHVRDGWELNAQRLLVVQRSISSIPSEPHYQFEK